MATDPTGTPSQPASATPVLDWFVRERRKAGYALFALSGVFLIVSLYCLRVALRHEPVPEEGWSDYTFAAILSFFLTAVFFGGALWVQVPKVQPGREHSAMRLALLVLGMAVGLGVALISFVYLLYHGNYLTEWISEGKKDHRGQVIVPLFLLLSGFLLAFVTVQLAQSQERNDPTMRQILYGSRAISNGFLLFLILVVVNVLIFYRVPGTLDTTQTGFYSLSEDSKEFIATIDQDVHVYMVMFEDGPPWQIYSNVRSLLMNINAINPKVKVEFLSPATSSPRIRELRETFPQLQRDGVLITFGPNQEQVQFIPAEEFIGFAGAGPDMDPRRQQPKRIFQGESKLIGDMRFLAEGKNRPVVYFTAGHGELTVSATPSRGSRDDSARRLHEYLEKRRVEVKTLSYDPLATTPPTVPEDATMVVVAGPKEKLSGVAVQSLQQYMSREGGKKGKLLLMLDAVTKDGAGGQPIIETGLEEWLKTYNVQVEPRIIMTADGQGEIGPVARLRPNPQLVNIDNRIASTFARSTFEFAFCRPILEASSERANPSYRTEELLQTMSRGIVWQDTHDRRGSTVQQIASDLKRRAAELRFPSEAVCAAMLVTDTGSTPPSPHSTAESKPRLAVFGTSYFLRDSWAEEDPKDTKYFELFAATIDWLRERPDSIAVEPKTYTYYTLDPNTVSTARLYGAPVGLMLLAIIGMGMSVWLVRRR